MNLPRHTQANADAQQDAAKNYCIYNMKLPKLQPKSFKPNNTNRKQC
jgi:hypothetical protein